MERDFRVLPFTGETSPVTPGSDSSVSYDHSDGGPSAMRCATVVIASQSRLPSSPFSRETGRLRQSCRETFPRRTQRNPIGITELQQPGPGDAPTVRPRGNEASRRASGPMGPLGGGTDQPRTFARRLVGPRSGRTRAWLGKLNGSPKSFSAFSSGCSSRTDQPRFWIHNSLASLEIC
jgi:hypothetical protein